MHWLYFLRAYMRRFTLTFAFEIVIISIALTLALLDPL